MKTLNIKDAPIKVFGIPFFDKKKVFERIPLEIREKVTSLEFYGRRCPGARVGFKTDAAEFTVRISFKTFSVDAGMSIFAAHAANVMVGERQNSEYVEHICPPDYETKQFEKVVKKSGKMEEVTIWLPRNEELDEVEIIFPDDANIEAPTPYKYGPALYYGSSITEGGCATGVTLGYNSLLSRWLDLDYYNFGFSGSARGEIEIADYINTIDFSLFVMDYDHNAWNCDELKRTHEPFFKRIREKHPDLPVLFLTRPNFYEVDDSAGRRDIVRETYENAIKNGDKNVYFIDGETFFGQKDRTLCTVDLTHPNDIGFYRMAETIYPVMKQILEKGE